MKKVLFILYVADQGRSRSFYASVLGSEPSLDVPGMTEFELSSDSALGLMPEDRIAKLITPVMPHPSEASGVPRCEFYLRVTDPEGYITRAVQAGGRLIQPLTPMNWGESVGYVADPNGHVLAFAEA